MLDAYVEPVNVDRAMAAARVSAWPTPSTATAPTWTPSSSELYQAPAAEPDAEVGLVLTRRFAFLMVVAARPGSPAEKAGLQARRPRQDDRRAPHPADAGGDGGAAAARGARLVGEARHPARGRRPVRGHGGARAGPARGAARAACSTRATGYVKVDRLHPGDRARTCATQVEALKRQRRGAAGPRPARRGLGRARATA